MRLRATLRTLHVGHAAHVEVLRVVNRLDLLLHLLHRGRRLRGGHLLLEIRRAALALAVLGVPAHLRAHPLAAALALLEDLLAFLHGLLERGVVLRPSDRPLHLVGAAPGAAEHTAEDVARGAQEPSRHAGDRSLEGRLVAVAAAVALEVELEAHVGGQVVVVFGESNQGHLASLPPSFR